MARTPKRVAVIGFDCPRPKLMEEHMAEGYLPTFKALFEGGVVADNCLVPFPTNHASQLGRHSHRGVAGYSWGH